MGICLGKKGVETIVQRSKPIARRNDDGNSGLVSHKKSALWYILLDKMIWKKSWLYLTLIILLSLFFQGLIAIYNQVPDYDEAIHFDLATSISKTSLPIWTETGGLYTHHPFLSFYLMAIPIFLTRSLFWGRVMASLLSVLIILFTYLIGRKVGGEKVGLIASFLLAINPLFLSFSFSLYTEVYLGVFLIASVFFFFFGEEKKKDRFYFLAGLFLGLALLTKYLAGILALAYLLFFYVRKGRKVFSSRPLFLIGLPAMAIFSLWPLFAFLADWSAFLESLRLWWGFRKMSVCDARVGVSGLKHFLALSLALSPPFAILTFGVFLRQVGDFVSLPRPNRQMGFLLLFVGLGLTVILWLTVKDIKYLYPFIPFLAILVGDYFKDFKLNFRILALVFIFLLLYFPYDFFGLGKTGLNQRLYFSLYMWRIDRDNEGCIQLGNQLRAVSGENETVYYFSQAAIGGYCSQRPYRTIGCSAKPDQAHRLLNQARVLIFNPPLSLPFFSEEEKQKLLRRIEEEFSLRGTVPGWGGLYLHTPRVI